MRKNKYTGPRGLFLDEYFIQIRVLEKRIKKTIAKKVRQFTEAADIDTICANCIDAIEKKLIAQFDAKPEEHFNNKEKNKKLALFKEDKAYVQKYILEATKTFCRKKQNFWGHGRTEGDASKGETHKAKKAGKAARLHFSGNPDEIDEWLDSLVACNVSKEKFQADDIKSATALFEKIGMNNKKIKCFWDRFAGITFVEMARQDPDPLATPDKYRKRLNRLIFQLAPHLEELEVIFAGQYE